MARKRKAGKRTKSGQLSRAHKSPELRDQGTPEGQSKRCVLVGAKGDQALAATALGILAAKGYIDRDQFTEGLEYARLRNILYGSPWPVSTVGAPASEARIKALKRRFNHKCKLLTMEQKHVLTYVAAFSCIPNWFYAAELKLKWMPEDHHEKALLLSGLDALCGRQQKRAA